LVPFFSDTFTEARLAARSFAQAGRGLVEGRLRIGVTGLARSGKTVFTTAFLHQLLTPGRLPALRALSEGRLVKAELVPQPDDEVPRFALEENLGLLRDRIWPPSTKRISEIRIRLTYESRRRWRGKTSQLILDLVDYPGEWLNDLALLETDFAGWSERMLAAARRSERIPHAAPFLARLAALSPEQPQDEEKAISLAAAFRSYLEALHDNPNRLAPEAPGRFLLPGEWQGSPMLTFAPLDLRPGQSLARGSFGAMMERRFLAYRDRIVKPFFREHFRRLDRQIVLVDLLCAIDAGASALRELEEALERILAVFRIGRNSLITSLFAPRIDKILFAATKADHLHPENHARLEALLHLLVKRALQRGEDSGAQNESLALAAIRATQATTIINGQEMLKAISGTPEAGERIGSEVFDGKSEAAIFSGDLPERVESLLNGALLEGSLRFPRFRPPRFSVDAGAASLILPHIRLDRAIEFLIGDHLA
jgi:uncharacterized protein